MSQLREAVLLRVFVGENDKWGGKPLYEAIVDAARAAGISGATVLKGVMGYGAGSELHTTKILRLSENLPMVVEIVDQKAAIDDLLDAMSGFVGKGLVTTERVQVWHNEGGFDGGS